MMATCNWHKGERGWWVWTDISWNAWKAEWELSVDLIKGLVHNSKKFVEYEDRWLKGIAAEILKVEHVRWACWSEEQSIK